MKFRIVLFLLTTFMAGITLSGQNINKKIYINGLVVDQANYPVAKVTIFIDGEKTSQVTNDKGFIKLRSKPEVPESGYSPFRTE
jgi:hypothetical protein